MAQANTNPKPRERTPWHPARKRLLLAVVLVMVGSFLPWVSTSLGNVSGARGAGIWTFYVALLGAAGVFIPGHLRRVAACHGAVMGLTAVGLTTWQLIHIFNTIGWGGWLPGPGLVMVFGGGVLALVAATSLFRGSE